ncbi:MAG TPA: condensation domain-containing protein, partial [Longimicrobiaceae bacterium]|nr:condensation domain-containing protein [Longimicrobiaceae bacterium]
MDRSAIEAIYPLSPLQQGMLFHTLYAPSSGTYFEQFAFTLRGALDEAAWEAAWERVTERHAVLRSAFAWEKREKPLQIVSRAARAPWRREDWRGLAEEERRARFEAFLREDRERGFELGRAPLMRLALLRVADDAREFVWSHHHLLLDGWSVGLVLGEVFELYEAFRAGEQITRPAPRPFREYVAWLGKRDPAAAEAFWRGELRGFRAPTPLGIDRGARAGAAGEYGEERLDLSPEATAALAELARHRRVTLSTVVQGAWALLLARYSGEDDVVFGATVSGRPAELPGVDRMVGLFINAVPVRVRVPSGALLAPWLQELQARQAETREHEHAPLVDVRAWSELPAGEPLFDSLLIFENFPVDASASEPRGGVEVAGFRAFERTNYPLTLVVAPAEGLVLRAMYEADRLDPAAVRRMLGHLRTLLEAAARDPEARLGELPLLGAEERARELEAWNATEAEFPRGERIHDRFEAVAARTPDAVALTFRGESLTYSELNRRANGVARRLSALGVGPESRVAVCLERGPEMVAALLGVLKAGGAYVPVDPAYPAERVAFVLEDAAVPVLLTQERLLGTIPSFGGGIIALDTPH